MSIPNIISIIRILLVPVFCVTYFMPGLRILSLVVLIFSGLSDVADGYIARKYNSVTDLGKVLDPFADKLFNMSAVACFCIDGKIGFWILAFVVAKELFMICGGVVLYKKTRAVIASKWYGKLSTCLFFAGFLSTFVPLNNKIYSIFTNCLFAVALFFSFYAMGNYVAKAVSINNAQKKN